LRIAASPFTGFFKNKPPANGDGLLYPQTFVNFVKTQILSQYQQTDVRPALNIAAHSNVFLNQKRQLNLLALEMDI
jgi:hypothetical protein